MKRFTTMLVVVLLSLTDVWIGLASFLAYMNLKQRMLSLGFGSEWLFVCLQIMSIYLTIHFIIAYFKHED